MICDSLTRASIIRWWFQRQPEHFLRRLMLSNWIDDNQAWNQPFHVNKNLGKCIERPDLVTRPRERRKINQNNWEREDLWRNDVSTQDAALCGQKQHSQCQLPIKSPLVTIGSSILKYFGEKIVWPELSQSRSVWLSLLDSSIKTVSRIVAVFLKFY